MLRRPRSHCGPRERDIFVTPCLAFRVRSGLTDNYLFAADVLFLIYYYKIIYISQLCQEKISLRYDLCLDLYGNWFVIDMSLLIEL